MGVVLVLTLAGLQLIHFVYLQMDLSFIHSGMYQMLLFAVAPAFYLFSKPLLKGPGYFQVLHLSHALPVIAGYWLPASIALPVAFIGWCRLFIMVVSQSLRFARTTQSFLS